MEQMTVTSVTALFPETKGQIKTFAEKMINGVLDGYTDPLHTKIQLTAMKKTIEQIESSKDLSDCVLNEALKYHRNELENIHNASVQVKETGIKYDYSFCGHSEYNRVCAEIELLSQRKKSLEKYLQSLQSETPYVDPQTGEEIVLVPPTKTSTTSVVVTINK